MLREFWRFYWAVCGFTLCVIAFAGLPSIGIAQEPAEQAPTTEEGAEEVAESESEETSEETTEEAPTKDAPPEDAPTEDAPTEDAPTEDAESDETAGGSGTANERFYELFEEWKSLLKAMREIRAEFLIADNEKLDELRQSFHDKGVAGEAMVTQLTAQAEDAYRESPNSDREIVRFLVSTLNELVGRDDYRPAKRLGEMLLEGGSKEKELPELAGLAAYGNNDFDATEQHLQLAVEAGTISERGSAILQSLEDCKTTWEEEVKIRAAEADDNLPQVRLQTDVGDVVVELFENEAPETVGNFISLVEKGYYDNLTFHRVLSGFMAQGGCPDGNGLGGPGYNVYCECVNDNHRNHFAGSLSMAKTMAVNTGGSQFFLTFAPSPNLNGDHTVFGRIVEGWETLPKIVRIDPEGDHALPPTKIIKAEVIRKRDHDYRPNKVR